MRSIVSFSLCCFSCLFFFGCSSPQMYYFGDYSETLYNLEKNPNEESLLEHKAELENIIATSEERSLAVPPGIYAELGYINMKTNHIKEAILLFEKEKALYPESYPLMKRLIQSCQKREEAKEDEDM